MTRLSKQDRARRLLLSVLALRGTHDLGPIRFTALSRLVIPVLTADQVASQLSKWEDAGIVVGASSLQDGLPEPVYRITDAGQAEWDRLQEVER